MRHRNFGKKLGRTTNQRRALFRQLVCQILTHGQIETTYAKAKAVIPSVERVASKLATLPDLLGRRLLNTYFQDRNQVKKVYNKFKATYPDVTFNFTRLEKIGQRRGDNATMVKLRLFRGFNSTENKEEDVAKTTPKTESAKPKITKTKTVKTEKNKVKSKT